MDQRGCSGAGASPCRTATSRARSTSHARTADEFAPAYHDAPASVVGDHKGGFYHDGRFATVKDVVEHYNDHFTLSLTGEEKRDLIEYLKSL